MTKKIKLTKSRQAWASQQSNSPTFTGGQLHPPASVSARYVIALSRITAQMTAQVKRDVLKLFNAGHDHAMDATISSQSRILVSALRGKFDDLFAKKSKVFARAMLNATERASATNMHSSLEQLSGGLSLKTKVYTTEVMNVYKASIAENVSLIKSIPTDYFNQVEGSVMRSITTGNGLQDLIPALEKYEGVTHRRAKNIALDQTRKAYNSINRSRMQAIGVEQFQWHHSGGGANPREDHVEMDGNIYSFNALPVIDQRTGERGIPGQAPNCRCTMSPCFQFSPSDTLQASDP